MNFMGVTKYGTKKIDSHKWETYAHARDGNYLTPVTWAREVHGTKKEATLFIDRLAKKHGWSNTENTVIRKVISLTRVEYTHEDTAKLIVAAYKKRHGKSSRWSSTKGGLRHHTTNKTNRPSLGEILFRIENWLGTYNYVIKEKGERK
jgi:hypothetical protein